jgi:hypothetical protein
MLCYAQRKRRASCRFVYAYSGRDGGTEEGGTEGAREEGREGGSERARGKGGGVRGEHLRI